MRNLSLGYLAGIVFFTGAFSWLGSLGVLYENFGLRGLSLLLSIYLGLYFAFAAWFIGLVAPGNFLGSLRNLATAFLVASAWAAQEWVRGWLFTGFGWNGLGVALHSNWPLIQIAEFTGVIGLSFVVVFANVIAVMVPFRLFTEASTGRMRPHFDLTVTLSGLVGLCAFGLFAAQNRSSAQPLRVAAVQPNIPQIQKFDPKFDQQTYDRLTRLSEIALQSRPYPELLIWPEGALPNSAGDAKSEFISGDFFGHAAPTTDLMLGADDFEHGHTYNAATLFSKHGEQIQTYRKIHLVPFGEYIPLRSSFPLFAQVAGRWIPGDFDRGSDYTVFRLTNSDVRIAPLICFEDTIGDLARRFVHHGANLLVNVTNDGWFLHSAASHQHLNNAIFRCVETRRPMVRAANTGVTCFVNEFGRVTEVLRDDASGTFTEGVLTSEMNVPQDRQFTFYVRHGELFAQVCAGITLFAIAVFAATRLIRRKSK